MFSSKEIWLEVDLNYIENNKIPLFMCNSFSNTSYSYKNFLNLM